MLHPAQASAPGDEVPPERWKEVHKKLVEPFDPGEIKWRVTATTKVQHKGGVRKRGQLVAYADQRAYTDRLNEVFGDWGWTRNYDVQVVQNFERRGGADSTQKAASAKVVVVSKVIVHGFGSHTGVGEEWADDENAATRAEAQAFKRACACFGLGRYLYDLGTVWVDLDEYNRPAQTPNLPVWALPSYLQKQPSQKERAATPKSSRQGLVRDEVLAAVRQLCNRVGFSLSEFALTTYGGTTDISKLGFTKLTVVMDRLTDLANGIARLGKAAEAIEPARYMAICRELNLASDSSDDIPDRTSLRMLVSRVEQEAAAKQNATCVRTGSAVSIADARGRLLQAARKAAENPRRGRRGSLGGIVAEASDGKLSIETLKNLTDADVPTVEAAIAKIAGELR
jgi:hypothetical protein